METFNLCTYISCIQRKSAERKTAGLFRGFVVQHSLWQVICFRYLMCTSKCPPFVYVAVSAPLWPAPYIWYRWYGTSSSYLKGFIVIGRTLAHVQCAVLVYTERHHIPCCMLYAVMHIQYTLMNCTHGAHHIALPTVWWQKWFRYNQIVILSSWCMRARRRRLLWSAARNICEVQIRIQSSTLIHCGAVPT